MRQYKRAYLGYLLVTPASLIFLLFILGPTLYVFYISFFRWNLLDSAHSRFIGVHNYASMLTSGSFWHSVWITIYFILGTVPTGVIISLAIAIFLMRSFRGRGFVRLAAFSPYVTPIVATSIVFIWIFNPQFGLLNGILHALHLPELEWLQSPHWAMPGIIIYTMWHTLGFNIIIFMSGLSGVSQELGEAARIDGATKWQEFRHVLWPLLSPTTLFVLIISTIEAIKAFTQFFTMTQGGPVNATTTTGYLLYQEAFIFYHTGYAAAITVFLFAFMAVLTYFQMRASRSRVHYQ